ncbi:MAG: hypothetical protein HC904_06140 [Blastochloris sp.]|nr:hypothetical protein [Blastochloris sp.]
MIHNLTRSFLLPVLLVGTFQMMQASLVVSAAKLEGSALSDYTIDWKAAYGAHGDGVQDDTAAILKAVAQPKGGVVFVPPGTYRVTDTIPIPKGVRLMGLGRERPVFVVKANTAGWSGPEKKVLISFSPQDGKKGNDTFYTMFSNIDLRIEPGNPAGVAISFDAAQGCVVSHTDITLGPGNVGIDRLGCEIDKIRITGGDYALRGGTVSWQTLILDSVFENQAKAAFNVYGIGPTLVRCTIRNTAKGFDIPGGEKRERIYLESCRLENISQALVELDQVKDRSQQVTILNSSFAQVPTLIVGRGGDTLKAPTEPMVFIEHVAHGVQLDFSAGKPGPEKVTQSISGVRVIKSLPELPARDIPEAPALERWKNVKTLGVMGDGKTDDTAALQALLGQAGVWFFPSGRYLVSNTLRLHPEAILIGLHPRSTLIQLPHQLPGYEDAKKPKAMLHAPLGGKNQVSGIGFDPGINPGAYAIHWQAGQESYLGDFWVSWAHGSAPLATSQAGVIWIEGGGGVFKNIWSGHKNPPTALHISNTKIPGKMYQASLEHKHGSEILIDRVSNWTFYNLQTEHSQGLSEVEESIPIEIRDSSDLIFVNTWLYRTSGTKRIPRDGISARNVANLRFYNLHNFNWQGKPAKFSYQDTGAGIEVQTKQLTTLIIGGK